MVASRKLSAQEAAEVIERFLEENPAYPQEWNDFVDSRRCQPGVEEYRKRCDELDPLVNRPDPQDQKALSELREIAKKLYVLAATQAGESIDVR